MPMDIIHGKYCFLCSLQKTKSIDKKLQQSYFIDIYVLLQNCMYIISSVVEFQRWWVLKSKIFGQESTYF